MSDPITLAATAVALLSPYLVKFGEKVAEGAGEGVADGGAKLLGWLKDKLTGRGKEALDDLTSAPESDDNKADLRKQLAKLIEAEPALGEELRSLLAEAGQSTGDATATASGDNAVAVSNTGAGSTISVQR
jgi:hypothetical protein